VEVKPFTGLAVHFVRQVGARIMLRGLRTTSDMEYEFNMSMANHALDPEIETVFLMAQETYSHVSGSLLRQIATFGGPLDKFVPLVVKDALKDRVREREQTGLQAPPGTHRSSAD
jgi:pantetheine-phosphate adenylyltransferase